MSIVFGSNHVVIFITFKQTMTPVFNGISKSPPLPQSRAVPDCLWKPTKGLPYMLTAARSPPNEEPKDEDLEAQAGQLVPRDGPCL